MKLITFYSGDSTYAFRLTPDQPGRWDWRCDCDEGYGLDGLEGSIEVAASDLLGGVIPDPVSPTYLMYESGKQYTMVGIEADWWAPDPVYSCPY